MTKKKDQPEEAIPQGEPTEDQAPAVSTESEWVQVVRLWADKSNARPVANHLQAELARVGIVTVEQLATAPVQLVAGAARAAIRADAQALQAAAHKFMEGKT